MTKAKTDFQMELEALGTVLQAVGALEPAGQTFVLRTAIDRLGISDVQFTAAGGAVLGAMGGSGGAGSGAGGGSNPPRDPKAFLKGKRPVNEVQRVAVLAYYLDRYKETKEFKTPDLVALNQDAGGLRIGNPARAVDNATRRSNYLVPVRGGKKKISAHGEDVVEALPDQAKVAEVEAAFVTSTRGGARKRPVKKAKK
jgi:hypothetical protein